MQSRLLSFPLIVPLLAFALLASALLVGCGGGSGDGGATDVVDTPSDTTAPPADVVAEDAAAAEDVAPADVPPADVPLVNAIRFTGEEGTSDAGAIWITAEAGDGEDELRVHLWAGGFPDVLGWAFDLRYHPGVLTLEDVALRDVLTERTWRGRCVARERGSGRLNVGCARFLAGDDMFGLAEYSGPLEGPAEFATLRFTIREPGSAELRFDDVRRLARGGAEPVLPIVWRGGTVTVDRVPAEATEGGRR